MTIASDTVLAMHDMALFVEVARLRSVTGASKALGIPPATLSRRLTLLERRIGLQLLSRSTRRIELTSIGLRYFERCERVVADAAAAQQVLAEAAQLPRGTLRVAAPVDFGVHYLAPILDEFVRHYPGITLGLELAASHVDLAGQRFDLAIRLGSTKDGNLVVRRLGYIERKLYASPNYLAARSPVRTPADLSRHECIMLSNESSPGRWLLRRNQTSERVDVSGTLTTNSLAMMLRWAELGNGIAPLTLTLARPAVDAGRLRGVLPEWKFERLAVSAVTPTRLRSASVRLLLEFLGEKLSRSLS